MVEGGPTLLAGFISEDLYDEIRVETAPVAIGSGLRAPLIPSGLQIVERQTCRENTIMRFRR